MEMRVLLLIAAFAPYCLANIVPNTLEYRENVRYRPCNLNDYRCIGDVLQSNSDCRRPVRGSIPQRYIVRNAHYETPFFNASYVEPRLIVKNLNLCFVSEFYINPTTDKAVLGIDCPDLDLEGDRLLIQHRSLYEDAYCRYHFRGEYPLIRVTLTLPARRMELRDSISFTEVLRLPRLAVQSLDPNHPTATIISRDLTPRDVFEAESFYYRGIFIARRVVQAHLCDYGYYLPYYYD
nr:fibrohexamerin-3 [Pseudoips prasinana]